MKTTLINQHDRLTVTAIESKGLRLNLTINRSGQRVSGAGMDMPALKLAMARFTQRIAKCKKYGDMMAEIAAVAEASSTIADFIGRL